LQLELTIEHQQKQLDELRSIVLALSTEIHKLNEEIRNISKNR